MRISKKLLLGAFTVVVGFSFLIASATLAGPLRSNDYQFEETNLGGTGLLDSSSANYQATESAGILGFGNSSDATMQVNNGHVTTSFPALSFAVVNPTVSLGNFSPSATATATSTFQVADYTSYGYIVQAVGPPPSNGVHTLTHMSTTGPSDTGVEQFGINLVANTSPVSLGANPNHGQFGYGSATTNYGTTNNYIYNSGDTVASAPKSSGVTTYTISYIVNVSDETPGGNYTGQQALICTGTY